MKTALKYIVLWSAIGIMVGSCSSPIKSLPSIYEINENEYNAYDETIISGQLAKVALKRYKESLAIVLVKDKQTYIMNGVKEEIETAGATQSFTLIEMLHTINIQGTYNSLVLRDSKNIVVGIKLTERLPE